MRFFGGAALIGLGVFIGLVGVVEAGPKASPASAPSRSLSHPSSCPAAASRPITETERQTLIAGRSIRGVVPPRLARFVEARYPAAAWAARIEAMVALELHLDARGRVLVIRALNHPGHGLAAAARHAARRFRFLPALSSGQPIPAVVVFRYAFHLPATARPPTSRAVSSRPPASRPVAASRPLAFRSLAPASRPSARRPREPDFTTVVRGQRPARSASDYRFTFDTLRVDVPAAGGTASQLLRRAPGLYISQHSGVGKAHQIFLRGFDAVHGQDVEIHVGGIPINEVSHIHAQGYADLNFLVPEAVLRLRVLEGAQDPRQGDFATAGSIDFDLGMARRGLLARVSAGSFGTWRGLVAWAPRDQPDASFVVADLARGGGFGPNRAWRRGSALGQALIPLSGRFSLRFLASTYAARFDSAGVVREDDVASGTVGFFDTYDPNQGGASTRHQMLFELRHRGRRFRSILATFLVLRELHLRDDFTGSLLDRRGDSLHQDNSSLTLGGYASTQAAFSFLSRHHRVEVGVRWRHDRVSQAQARLLRVDGTPYRRDVDADLAITDLGIYGDLDLDLWPHRLALRGGLRAEAQAYDIADALAHDGVGDQRDAFGFFMGPKVTLEAHIVDGLRAFIGYGRGFRSPQALSLGQGEQAPFAVVDSGEVGLAFAYGKTEARRWLRGSVTGFYTYIADDMIFDHAIGRNLFVGGARRLGIAWLVQFRPLSWLQLIHSGTWVRATHVEDGAALPYAPTLVLRSDLDMQRVLAKVWGASLRVFGGIGWTTLGARPLPYGEKSRPVNLIDLDAGVEWHDIALSLQVVNLADARWRDGEFVYASNFSSGTGAPSQIPVRHSTAGSPLTIQGTLTARF
ncbi:MAG: TonB-dependent receptor [Deltaproteobacteria bacterium]|nr:TonB-dependent receptor [Deltaproteobacteria bacterium]